MENTPLCCLRLKSLYYLKFIFYRAELCNLVLSVVTSSDTSGLFVVTSPDTSGLFKFCELNTY